MKKLGEHAIRHTWYESDIRISPNFEASALVVIIIGDLRGLLIEYCLCTCYINTRAEKLCIHYLFQNTMGKLTGTTVTNLRTLTNSKSSSPSATHMSRNNTAMHMVDSIIANRRPTQLRAPSEKEKKLAGLAAEMVSACACSAVYLEDNDGGGEDGVFHGFGSVLNVETDWTSPHLRRTAGVTVFSRNSLSDPKTQCFWL